MSSNLEKINKSVSELLKEALEKNEKITVGLKEIAETSSAHTDPLMMLLCIFALAIFVGYYVVWRVTPALHSPLMAVTNAISSVIIVGGVIGAGVLNSGTANTFGLLAIFLASINIFGGFVVTGRMLEMFKRKK